MNEEMKMNLEEMEEDFDVNEPEVEAEEAPQPLSMEELEEATGGAGPGLDYVHNLAFYVWKPVHNAKNGYLPFRSEPGGAKMNIYVPNGANVFVHKNYEEKGFYLAYDFNANLYGYVDKRCVGY